MIPRKKICFVVTAEFAVKAFLLGHLRALSELYDVTVIVNTSNPNFLVENGLKVKVIPLAMARKISLLSDVHSLITLIKIFRNCHFDSVHSITPKAGLLAMFASWLVRVPLRIHTFTGQVWVVNVGIKRFLIKQIDRLIASLSTFNIVDSPSQRQFLVDEKVLDWSKSIVFSKGSISGVDVARFKAEVHKRIEVRQRLNIADNAIIFLFVGRLTFDKGVLDLAHAFTWLSFGSAHLLFVGPDEDGMQVDIKHITQGCNSNVHFVDYTDVPECYMAASDVLCLPSYREGFGSVVIEAAAVGIPAIASRIYGIFDAVVDNETGLLHEPHDISTIQNLMECLVNNQELRLSLGAKARLRALKDFDSHLITQEWCDFYHKKLH